MRIAGIDYGSKLAGTTAICFLDNDLINFASSKKGEDADSLIKRLCREHEIELVAIDAPLSLPAAYQQGSKSIDFMFRKADIELKAMSPMFLGGLTARAMRLGFELTEMGISVIEVYPRGLVRITARLSEAYPADRKGESLDLVANCASVLREVFDLNRFQRPPATRHELDSLIAFVSAGRFVNKCHIEFGLAEEGLIRI
jgi:predicted nuclease with RNAse H fold